MHIVTSWLRLMTGTVIWVGVYLMCCLYRCGLKASHQVFGGFHRTVWNCHHRRENVIDHIGESVKQSQLGEQICKKVHYNFLLVHNLHTQAGALWENWPKLLIQLMKIMLMITWAKRAAHHMHWSVWSFYCVKHSVNAKYAPLFPSRAVSQTGCSPGCLRTKSTCSKFALSCLSRWETWSTPGGLFRDFFFFLA